MSKQTLILAIVVSAVFVCNSQAAQINSNWVGESWGQWDQANNWNPNIIPDNDGNTFNVTINSGGGGVDIEFDQSRTINQLDCNGVVEIELGTSGWAELVLEDANGLTNHGELSLSGSTFQINITGTVTNSNGAMLELGKVEINGSLYNSAGATIKAEAENDVEGNLQNEGELTIIHSSDVLCESNLYNTGLINLYSGECGVEKILDNNSSGTIRGSGVVYANQLLNNEGNIYAYGGSLVVLSEGSITNMGTLANKALSILHIQPSNDVNNLGTIEVNAGGGVAFDCNLVNEPNGIIEIYGGTLSATTITQTANANLVGFGSITSDVVIDPNGIIKLTGPTNIVGDVNIGTNATLEISDGVTLVTGYTINNGTIHMKGGRLIPQGGITNNGNVIWEPGLYNNVADFNLDGQVNFKDFADFSETWLWQSSL